MHPSRPHAPLSSLPRVALLLLVATWGCGGSTYEPKTTKPNPPVRIVVVTSPKTTAEAGAAAGDFVVRVENASGQGSVGQRVTFGQQSGPTGFGFAPSTVTTDSSGLARTAVTFRTEAGTDQLLARVDGVASPAQIDVTITPAPPAYVLVTPGIINLFGVGDTASFQVKVTDIYLNVRKDATPAFKVSDSTSLSVTPPAAFGANGTVRALKGGVSTTIDVTLGGTTGTLLGRMTVGIYANPRNVCAGIATPQDVPYGVPVTVTDSIICIAPTAGAANYSLMVYNASTDGAASLGTTVTGTNVALQLPVSGARIGTRPLLTRAPAPALSRRSTAPKLDTRFHQRLMEQSRSLRRLFGAARTTRSFARRGSTGRIRGPSYALNSSAPTVPVVDDLVSLNVASDACATADMRTFRVEAVGDKSIVLADTTNPPGFMRADYQRFATRFDTLVYPLDVGNFDTPTDIDGNGHVAILFTRAVNELTPANADAFVGGFFHPRDLFPRAQSPSLEGCATSNEGEMFYMMVPDPTGVVNGNMFRVGFVDTLTTGILAHEFQHLINAGRRLYVNSASDFEEVWLNEGLSHEAEELLFFRESGFRPRARLGAASLLDTRSHYDAFVSDDASNFVNFYWYLSDPASHSPIVLEDALETRGAAWAFLRFAVDRSFDNDVGVWQRFVNSTTTGLGTLNFALQRDPKSLLQDFALANMLNSHPSWNFGDVYGRFFVGVAYPVPFVNLQEGTAVQAAARGGSASYYQFSVLDNVQALLRFGSSAAPPNGNLRFVLMRKVQ